VHEHGHEQDDTHTVEYVADARDDAVIEAGHGKEDEGAAGQPRELLREEGELALAHGAPQIEQTEGKAQRCGDGDGPVA
jgi:hypothetical protein